jgi:hypothetical protein
LEADVGTFQSFCFKKSIFFLGFLGLFQFANAGKFLSPSEVPNEVYVVEIVPGKTLDSAFGHLAIVVRYSSRLKNFTEDDVAITSGPLVAPGSSANPFRAARLFAKAYPIGFWKLDYPYFYKQYHTDEQRDMKFYALKLNSQQKLAIVAGVNAWLTEGAEKPYSLFVRNCSSVIADLLEEVLNKDFSGLARLSPLRFPRVLLKENLVRRIIEIPFYKKPNA